MVVNHSTQGAETVNAINNLALLTGQIGRVGASPFSITGQCKAMGPREAGFASSLPGYCKLENASDRKELAALWSIGEAHLRLPAAIWGEKEGAYTNSERRVSKVNAAVDPPGEARPDFDIFLDRAGRLGERGELFPGWTSPRDAFDEWKLISKGRLYNAQST